MTFAENKQREVWSISGIDPESEATGIPLTMIFAAYGDIYKYA